MIAEVTQSIGLIADGIGIYMVANGFRKIKIEENSPYGIATNTSYIIAEVINAAIPGSRVLMLGFFLQFLGLWLGVGGY